MPARVVLRRPFVAVVMVALLSACGGGADRVATPPTAPEPTSSVPTTSDARPMKSCVASERGYRLAFPASWSTNESADAEPCRFFHPETFTLPRQTEATGIAVNVRLNPVAFDEVVPAPGGSAVAEMLDRRVTTIDGRRAVRSETRSTGRALLPFGTVAVRWFVDAEDATLVAATSEAAAAGRFEDNVNVLDAMMQSLRILERPATCSARRSAPESTPQAELPQAVAATRTAIRRAAKACDYDELAALALAGDSQFTHLLRQPWCAGGLLEGCGGRRTGATANAHRDPRRSLRQQTGGSGDSVRVALGLRL